MLLYGLGFIVGLVPVVLLIVIVAFIAIKVHNKNAMEPNAVGAAPHVRTTPKDFFLHVGAMIALYICVGSLLTLLFTIINRAFPDALDYGGYYYGYGYDPDSSTFRWTASIMIVLFPLLWLISWVLNKGYALEPAKRTLALRKWLIYLTLFLAGATLIGDLIAIIYKFLGGEITMRFVLKAFSTLVVSGLVFAYFFYDLRDADRRDSVRRIIFIASALLILASVILGMMVIGSPMKQRLMQFDNRKVNDLQSIQNQVVSHWQQKKAVPETLDALRDPISSFAVPTDPETGEAYTYEKTGPLSFKLCADFNYETDKRTQNRGGMMYESMPYPIDQKNNNWEHGKGVHCFDRTIDPEIYRPYPTYDPYGRPASSSNSEDQLVRSNLESAQKLATSYFLLQNNYGPAYPASSCPETKSYPLLSASTTPMFVRDLSMNSDINNAAVYAGSNMSQTYCATNSYSYGIMVPLRSGGYWCVDSTGASKEVPTKLFNNYLCQ